MAFGILTTNCFKGDYSGLPCTEDVYCGGLMCIDGICGGGASSPTLTPTATGDDPMSESGMPTSESGGEATGQPSSETGEQPADTDGVVLVAAGPSQTCAWMVTNQLRCWGENGAKGLGTPAAQAPDESCGTNPAYIVDLGEDATDLEIKRITVGTQGDEDYSCVSFSDGSAKCWGSGMVGEAFDDWLGYGQGDVMSSSGFIEFANRVIALEIDAGYLGTCAIVSGEQLTCFGRDDYAPVKSPNSKPNFKAVAMGREHGCAIDSLDRLVCWGTNTHGQVGVAQGAMSLCGGCSCGFVNLGDSVDAWQGRKVKHVSGGRYHTCAVMDDEQVWCWGYSGKSQLGTDMVETPCYNSGDCDPETSLTEKCSYEPLSADLVNQALAERHVVEIMQLVSGDAHNCVLVRRDEMYVSPDEESIEVHCWGDGVAGQLGTANVGNGPSTAPKLVDFDFAVGEPMRISAHLGNHTCAVFDSGQLWCWGANDSRQVDRCGGDAPVEEPRKVFP